MAADDGFVDHLLELLEPIDGVTARRMFGGHGLFRGGLMFGLVSDSSLYLKVDDVNKPEFEDLGLGPFTYEGKGKPMSMSYHRAPEEALDDGEDLCVWAESAYDAAVRARTPKKAKKK